MDYTLRSPALERQTEAYPAEWQGRVPRKIRMLKGLLFTAFRPRLLREGHIYPVYVESDGALYVLDTNNTVDRMPAGVGYEVVEFHCPGVCSATPMTAAQRIEV